MVLLQWQNVIFDPPKAYAFRRAGLSTGVILRCLIKKAILNPIALNTKKTVFTNIFYANRALNIVGLPAGRQGVLKRAFLVVRKTTIY
ncbi:hypothetical protein A2W54_01245 [Candidatus Giovannonibacteria bacterium RIFCSPHIGHO2_02_43_13]|uniref:Uncharacterized protein n=1 Tax=Candidatus Giovannonibacteria bacterium RIFCSPHIGHO2_02_43_13 TaxID=1798330 RepID=A0A1F5WUL5_9BACT|nr:MAG: hypothetical protein A3E06_03270 [Candidatus Giovannonibacteria bacterium RIFCSPHIGHO2_12_FULL_44_42]OGF79340.1 MAG: hypothetical protein A2W54_01245 [Candidatus Giovannonibacteria bacterium RIFCSPHIGHO2_02_43_13]OGF90273.1 MAG: hypothetical protein A3I94_01605 [Candidatus Giovannonibacteria bacterium RIFCSPLOWO2_02_FULL_43_54]OGF97255.1 MAG: hypothetical protein A3H08_02775 [Candidatus Giovannonibacteria bacterium RIFCSPLOWO2_12_FULL_44_32]